MSWWKQRSWTQTQETADRINGPSFTYDTTNIWAKYKLKYKLNQQGDDVQVKLTRSWWARKNTGSRGGLRRVMQSRCGGGADTSRRPPPPHPTPKKTGTTQIKGDRNDRTVTLCCFPLKGFHLVEQKKNWPELTVWCGLTQLNRHRELWWVYHLQVSYPFTTHHSGFKAKRFCSRAAQSIKGRAVRSLITGVVQ